MTYSYNTMLHDIDAAIDSGAPGFRIPAELILWLIYECPEGDRLPEAETLWDRALSAYRRDHGAALTIPTPWAYCLIGGSPWAIPGRGEPPAMTKAIARGKELRDGVPWYQPLPEEDEQLIGPDSPAGRQAAFLAEITKEAADTGPTSPVGGKGYTVTAPKGYSVKTAPSPQELGINDPREEQPQPEINPFANNREIVPHTRRVESTAEWAAFRKRAREETTAALGLAYAAQSPSSDHDRHGRNTPTALQGLLHDKLCHEVAWWYRSVEVREYKPGRFEVCVQGGAPHEAPSSLAYIGRKVIAGVVEAALLYSERARLSILDVITKDNWQWGVSAGRIDDNAYALAAD